MKIDLKKELASYRAPRGAFEIVEVPALTYLMIDGHGDPNHEGDYGVAVGALFAVAYALKFLSKRELDRDYVVMPLEGLWWADDMSTFTTRRDKSRWSWTLLNLVPAWIEAHHVERARDAAAAKGTLGVERLRLETLDEGRCAQTLHIGPYDDEGPVLDELHARYIPAAGLRMTGLHHEIYLSDVRRTAPEKLRTILRQPVALAD